MRCGTTTLIMSLSCLWTGQLASGPAQIIQEWDDYFARYRILECRIMEETERDSYGDIAIVDIWSGRSA